MYISFTSVIPHLFTFCYYTSPFGECQAFFVAHKMCIRDRCLTVKGFGALDQVVPPQGFQLRDHILHTPLGQHQFAAQPVACLLYTSRCV